MTTISDFQFPGEKHHHVLFAALAGANRYQLLLAALAVAVVGFVFNALRNPLAKVPGPWYSKFTGIVLSKHWLKGTRARYVHKLHEQYGPVVRAGPHEVDVMDIPSVKQIHTTKATYIKSSFYDNLPGPGVKELVDCTDVEFHRRHRRLLQGPFSEHALTAFHPIVERRVQLTIQRMGEEETDTRGVVDVYKWWSFMTSDIISELTFGESFQMLESGKKSEYTLMLEKAGPFLAIRSTFPTLVNLALGGVPIPGLKESIAVFQTIRRLAEVSLDRYRKLIENDPDTPIPTLFTRLFKGEEDGTLTPEEILDEAQLYIVAGSDTTSITLTYLVWRVCRDPIIKSRLVGELQQLPEDYHDRDLIQLPYLNQVINESLRLHSAAPSALPRVVPPGGATMGGHYLPGGSIVCTQSWSLHRNPDVFPDPERFDPDRWASPTRDMKDSFMPFGGGSRICLGLHLARLELRLASARFFRAFPSAKVSALEGMCDDDMEQITYFLAPPKGRRCLIECL